jgi:hypothetical protein
MNSVFKNIINLFMTTGFIGGLSFLCFQSCNWYGCNGWSSFFRADLICNACTDVSYSLKNYQISLYGSMFTLISYQLTGLINRAGTQTDTYIFEDYQLGKKSPRSLKVKK